MDNIHWYPGHMAKAKKAIMEDLKLIDIVIEILDARIPHSSKNHDIDTWTSKPKIVLLNKVDMADDHATQLWKEHFEQQENTYVILMNAKNGSGFKEITKLADSIMAEKLARLKARGRLFKPTRSMIVGIPNVGKSTFINSYVNKNIAKAANKPGVTRSNQWVKINKSFELLDTPGMLNPKLENPRIGLKLALTGAIGYTMDNQTLAFQLLEMLRDKYPHLLMERFKLTTVEGLAGEQLLHAIGLSRGLLTKGGEPDMNRCANIVLDEFKNMKIGKITLELPDEVAKEVADYEAAQKIKQAEQKARDRERKQNYKNSKGK